jgi:ribosome-binding factor A
VMKRVVLKYTPRLHFHADHSIERGVNMVSLLDSIAEDLPPDEEIVDDAAKESPNE